MIVIGTGPPRSGTTSLAALLDAQDGAHVTHERGPGLDWDDPNKEKCEDWLARQEGKSLVGDVGYKWLPGLKHVKGRVTVISLWRRPDRWLDSFIDVIHQRWLRQNTEAPPACRAFGGSDAERALMYRKRFYRRLNEEVGVSLRVRTEALSRPGAQEKLLRRLGIEDPVLMDDCHRNKRSG